MTKVIVAIGILSVLFFGQNRVAAQNSDDAAKAAVKNAGDQGSTKEDRLKEKYDSEMEAHREAMKERAGNDPEKKEQIQGKLQEEGKEHKENMTERAYGKDDQAGVDKKDASRDEEKARMDADLEAKKQELKTKAGDDPVKQEQAKKEYEEYRTSKYGASRDSMNNEKSPTDKSVKQAKQNETKSKEVKKAEKKKPKQ